MIPAIYFDGMQDHLNNCPTLTKRYNGFLDSDGCSDSFDSKLNSDMDRYLVHLINILY